MFVFLLCVGPICIYNIFFVINYQESKKSSLQCWGIYLYCIYFLQYCVNCVIYCYVHDRFRSAFKQLFSKLFGKVFETPTLIDTLSSQPIKGERSTVMQENKSYNNVDSQSRIETSLK